MAVLTVTPLELCFHVVGKFVTDIRLSSNATVQINVVGIYRKMHTDKEKKIIRRGRHLSRNNHGWQARENQDWNYDSKIADKQHARKKWLNPGCYSTKPVVLPVPPEHNAARLVDLYSWSQEAYKFQIAIQILRCYIYNFLFRRENKFKEKKHLVAVGLTCTEYP